MKRKLKRKWENKSSGGLIAKEREEVQRNKAAVEKGINWSYISRWILMLKLISIRHYQINVKEEIVQTKSLLRFKAQKLYLFMLHNFQSFSKEDI